MGEPWNGSMRARADEIKAQVKSVQLSRDKKALFDRGGFAGKNLAKQQAQREKEKHAREQSEAAKVYASFVSGAPFHFVYK
jgi:Mg-chelatase subunit ChlI